jgi:hypothetical protein
MGNTDLLSNLDSIVARVSSSYDADEADVAERAARILRERYAGARVQAFVPILIEKALRDLLRERRAATSV